MDQSQRLQRFIDDSRDIVFFGGAGVSTESGIPDFRGDKGTYRGEHRYPPELILSHTFYVQRTGEFFDFYRRKMLHLSAKPNRAHLKLAELEASGKLKAVVTQNIDGLHQAAGSKNVLELHGSVHRNFCEKCGRGFSAEFILNSRGVPACPCGGVVKPDVVLYEESLNDGTLVAALKAIERCDMLIVGGTSLAVYPAAGLVEHYRGNKLVLINKSPTPYDGRADLTISGSIGDALEGIHG